MSNLVAKMKGVMGYVESMVFEREEIVNFIAIALLTRKNVFILGGTGQAKSYVIDLFRKCIDGSKQFKTLMTKFKDEEQLFGRIDLNSLIQGNPQINTTNKIPDVHYVYIDETFKANDGVLNSLLTAMNEREYTNEGITIKLPVHCFFGSSNEIPDFNDPEQKILIPFYDRFEIKLLSEYVKEKSNVLLALKKVREKSNTQPCTITLAELEEMQMEVSQISIPDNIDELVYDIKIELKQKGIEISDRKLFNYYPLAQAQAWLNGRTVVSPEDLTVLKNYFWTKPTEIETIAQVLERYTKNPLKERIDAVTIIANEVFDQTMALDLLTQSNSKARQFSKFRREFVRAYDMLFEIHGNASTDKDKEAVGAALETLEDMSFKVHEKYGFTYAKLGEIKLLINP